MKRFFLLISLIAINHLLFAQDYFTGKITDEKGNTSNIFYDRTQLLVSPSEHQTLYKVVDDNKKSLYTIFLTHNQDKATITVSVSIDGSDTRGKTITYNKQKCGLIFSDAGNTDTIFPASLSCTYLLSFTDTGRDYPVLHRLKTFDKKEIELDPLTHLRLRKHNELVKKFYPVSPLAKVTKEEHKTTSPPSSEEAKVEQLTKETSLTYSLLNDTFNIQLFGLRDSMYAKNSQYIDLVTKMRNNMEYDVSMYMKDARVYSDEDRYGGEERNGQPQGKGVLVTDGNIFDGTFANGLFVSGIAVIKSKNSAYYGESIKNNIEGKGWLKYANGAFLLGEFKNGTLTNGITLSKDNGEVFFGSLKNNQRTGYGELRNSKGDSYYGEFLNGRLIKGYCKEVDQFGYSTYSRVQNGRKATISTQLAEAFFDSVHNIKEKAEN